MENKIVRILNITLSVLICLFGWLSPSYAGNSPWPLFLAAINATKNNITFDPPNNQPPPGTVTSLGRVWMDRNLGASRVAISVTDSAAYGDLYQWGRGTDGHEKRNSLTTSTNSSSDTPGHGRFILTDHSGDIDWRNPKNDNLWQGVSGTNNPCPVSFRLPTDTELATERLSWSSNNSVGAFASPLKLTVAGYRYLSSGMLRSVGSVGNYWSSTVNNVLSYNLNFYSDNALRHNTPRTYGYSVRCLKD